MSTLRLRYQTIEYGQSDIHLRTLKDNQQFEDKNQVAEELGISSASWPLFGIVWASGEVLSRYMFDFDIKGKKVLEVGCGIGLTSLVLNQRNCDITATDYHPEAGKFLRHNVALNQGREIPFTRTGWADLDSGLGKFDLIVGSDLLYEVEHIELLSQFISRHANSRCQVIIVDPGRGQHAKYSKAMIKLGFTHEQFKPQNIDYLDAPFKGVILIYNREPQ